MAAAIRPHGAAPNAQPANRSWRSSLEGKAAASASAPAGPMRQLAERLSTRSAQPLGEPMASANSATPSAETIFPPRSSECSGAPAARRVAMAPQAPSLAPVKESESEARRDPGPHRAVASAATPPSWMGLCSSESDCRVGCAATAAARAVHPASEMKLQPSERCSRWRFVSSAAPRAESASTGGEREPQSASLRTLHSSPDNRRAIKSNPPSSPPPDWPRSTSRRNASGASPPTVGLRLSAAAKAPRSCACGSSPRSGRCSTSLRSRTAGCARRRSSGVVAPLALQSALSTRRSCNALMSLSNCSGVHEPGPTLVPLSSWIVRCASAADVTAALESSSQPATSRTLTKPLAIRPSVSRSNN
eukprot:scaffold234658_cov30-Tisochrysis_lutea.AAC.3